MFQFGLSEILELDSFPEKNVLNVQVHSHIVKTNRMFDFCGPERRSYRNRVLIHAKYYVKNLREVKGKSEFALVAHANMIMICTQNAGIFLSDRSHSFSTYAQKERGRGLIGVRTLCVQGGSRSLGTYCECVL